MSDATDQPSATERAAPGAFRRLPDPIRLEDTVPSLRGDSPPDPDGERNDFIAAAINAGG